MRYSPAAAVCLIACFVALGCVSAPGTLPGPESNLWNAESPRGKWIIVAYEMYGHAHAVKGAEEQFVFTETTVERHGPATVQSGTYTVDPTQTPTGIDIEFGNAPADEKGRRVCPGIYKVENGTLTLCLDMATTHRTRPRTFSTAGSNHNFVLYVCRRAR